MAQRPQECPRCGGVGYPQEIPGAFACLIHGEFYIVTDKEIKGLKRDDLAKQLRNRKKREKDALIKRRQAALKRSLGLCTAKSKCMSPAVKAGRCETCRKSHNESQRRSYRKKTAEKKEKGECRVMNCNSPVVPNAGGRCRICRIKYAEYQRRSRLRKKQRAA